MKVSKRTIGTVRAALGLAVCGNAAAAPSNKACEARVNDTADKLVDCIRQQPLFDHLVAFQAIADRNPGADGHGNRDTGTPGYKASVDYVAALVRGAGYRVTIQPYEYTDIHLNGVPIFNVDGKE